MLEVKNLSAGYDDIQVLRDVSLRVREHEIVALLGNNGAGKTTLVNTISGLVHCWAGEVLLDGESIKNLYPAQIVERGLVQVPEGRKIFTSMSVLENLEMGAYRIRPKSAWASTLEEIYQLFPVLRARHRQMAGSLSGGEQQMLAIGRALMCKPRLLILDEPALGLAPRILQDVYAAIEAISRAGVTVLIVDQRADMAIRAASRSYIMHNGRMTFEGTQETVLDKRKTLARNLLQ
jgi:branched-chain amino acid transport system ATP-binding protein